MKQLYSVLILTTLFFGTNTIFAQTFKIGYVDADSVLRSFPEAQKKQEELQEYSEKLQKALVEKRETFQKKYDDYVQNANGLPDVVRADKEKELQALSQSIQEFEQEAQNDLSQKESLLMQPVLQKIKEGIDNVAKENGYTYIVPKNVLLYGEEKYDMTTLVIKKLGGKL